MTDAIYGSTTTTPKLEVRITNVAETSDIGITNV
jgi:hypothetical protein